MSLASSRSPSRRAARFRTIPSWMATRRANAWGSPWRQRSTRAGSADGAAETLSADEKASSLEAIATSKPTAAHLDTGSTSPVPVAAADRSRPDRDCTAGRPGYSEPGIKGRGISEIRGSGVRGLALVGGAGGPSGWDERRRRFVRRRLLRLPVDDPGLEEASDVEEEDQARDHHHGRENEEERPVAVEGVDDE